MFVFFSVSIGQAYAGSLYNISVLNNNEIKVESTRYGSDMRVMVEKGNDKYYYNLNNSAEEIPAQLGKGIYLVKILENTSENKYKVVYKSHVDMNSNSIDVFLSSSQPVYWENKTKLTELADQLTRSCKTDKEKIEAVYDYIVNNIKYDFLKTNYISDDYVPDIEAVIESKKGICYDYAALFAGILRSEGIYTKLVKGYKNDMNAYHAWNEVLLEGEWVLIDTTYDAALSVLNNQSMIKAFSEYNKIREY
jgi:transglutaminase-like putative cysteine protease